MKFGWSVTHLLFLWLFFQIINQKCLRMYDPNIKSVLTSYETWHNWLRASPALSMLLNLSCYQLKSRHILIPSILSTSMCNKTIGKLFWVLAWIGFRIWILRIKIRASGIKFRISSMNIRNQMFPITWKSEIGIRGRDNSLPPVISQLHIHILVRL